MNIHPDTVGRVASVIHQERIAAARRANLIRRAERLERTDDHRLVRFAASIRRNTIRGLGSTRPAAAPAQRIGQTGSNPV